MTDIRHCACCPVPMMRDGQKRPNGAGALYYERKRRRWVVAVLKPGVKRLYAYAKSRDAAEVRLAELQALVGRGT